MTATPLTTPGANVYLDGEDVSDRCFYADDRNGIVGLYLRNANGRFYVVGTQADPNWKPNWPQFKLYDPMTTETGLQEVEIKLASGWGEIAREIRSGAVRIELQQHVESDGVMALT